MRINNRLIILCAVFFIVNSVFAQKNQIPVINSGKKSISYRVDQKVGRWSISPELSPDRLELYCPGGKKEVCFKTDKDSIAFLIGAGDTAQFIISLNEKEALTEIVGFNSLPDRISDQKKIYYLSLLWSEAKYNFVNMDKVNFSWDSLYLSFIPLIGQTSNDYEYYQLLKKFMAKLGDGHTGVSDNGRFSQFRDYIPLTMKQFGKKIYIKSIRKGIGLDSAYIGAELIRVSGIPIDRYLKDSIYPYVSASTQQHLQMQAVGLLHSNFTSRQFNATVKKNTGQISNITLSYNGEATRSNSDGSWGRTANYSRNVIEFDILKNNIALLSINTFRNRAINQIDEKISEINETEGVIIDLRKNGGGSTEVAWYLQAILSKEEYFLNYSWQTRINNGVKKANGNWKEEYKEFYTNSAIKTVGSDTIPISDTLNRITVPVVILVGNYTFSAAEDFLVNIYEIDNRPVIIGEETGGSTGSPLVVPLPNNGYGRICTRRIRFPYSKKPFVNQGIKPDYKVVQTFDEYIQGIDPVIEKAIEFLSQD